MSEQILARVRKMLALANDAGATEGERDNALRMAHATLAKYNLDLAAAEMAGIEDEADSSEPRVEQAGKFGGWAWAQHIANSIAELFFCRYLVSGSGSSTRHYFVGREANAVTASLVAEFVVKSVHREAQAYVLKRYPGYDFLRSSRTDAVRSFGEGAAWRIQMRVAELKSRQPEEPGQPAATGNGTAVVLRSIYESEDEANKAFIDKLHPEVRTKRARRISPDRVSFRARDAGEEFGRVVSLDPQIKSRA